MRVSRVLAGVYATACLAALALIPISSRGCSIRDGTIDGRLLITNTSVVDYDFSVRGLEIGRGAGSNSISNLFSPQPVITSQALFAPTVVPEPTTMLLLLAGLSALLIVRRGPSGVASHQNCHAMHVVAR